MNYETTYGHGQNSDHYHQCLLDQAREFGAVAAGAVVGVLRYTASQQDLLSA